MLAHHTRIVPARSSVLVSPLLHHAAVPRCTSLVHRPFATTAIRRNKEDGSSNSSGANGNSLSTPASASPSNNSPAATTAVNAPASSTAASTAATPDLSSTTVTEADRKRAEERDATLKEILESAAAEARSLERERLAEEARRQKALKKAAAAERARQEELERIKAAAIRSAVPEDAATTKSSSGAPSSSSSSLSSSTTESKQLSPEQTSQASKDASTSSTAADGSKSSMTATSSSSPSSTTTISQDPLDEFRARLLPYKKSFQSSTEYLISSIPDSLRELSDSIKRKDYQSMISQLAKHLNTITGYNAIDELKRQVISHGDALDVARIKLAQTKHAYEEAIAMRSNTQKAINDLLQRKHLWSPNDVIRFTDLYRSEHANEQAEIRAKEAYRHAEEEVEEKSRKLTTVIMERYHGEQVWSDKIRAASTYGTWGLVGVNVMAFLIVQAFVEPRRRRKQIERYEELVQDLTDRGILPSTHGDGAVAGTGSTMAPSSTPAGPIDMGAATAALMTSGETDDEEAHKPTAAAHALDGGIDILERLVQLAQDQEARLARMEVIMTGQDAPPAIAGAFSETQQMPVTEIEADAETGGNEVVMTDDGTILLVHYGDGLEAEVAAEPTGLDAETWPDQLAAVALGRSTLRHARPASSSSASSVERDQRAWTERVKGMLASQEDPVLMKKRDYWLSGLGGAILGSIVTGLIVMATNR
ncbi:sensitivity to high expression protein she9 [Actinomortierella ambigua]|nr:sensitivity to high expression protein she9 [Actinomortierella ambigua]